MVGSIAGRIGSCEQRVADRPKAIAVDRDGTLASVAYCAPSDRNNENWRVYNGMLIFDSVVPRVAQMIRHFSDEGYVIIMFSGRMAGDKKGDWRRYYTMQTWIRKHNLPISHLYMRPGGDMRPDSEVKNEMLDAVLPHFDVILAVDDREVVCEKVWRARGIPLIQVVDPDIPPRLYDLDDTEPEIN